MLNRDVRFKEDEVFGVVDSNGKECYINYVFSEFELNAFKNIIKRLQDKLGGLYEGLCIDLPRTESDEDNGTLFRLKRITYRLDGEKLNTAYLFERLGETSNMGDWLVE
jgi:hypothetical protein